MIGYLKKAQIFEFFYRLKNVLDFNFETQVFIELTEGYRIYNSPGIPFSLSHTHTHIHTHTHTHTHTYTVSIICPSPRSFSSGPLSRRFSTLLCACSSMLKSSNNLLPRHKRTTLIVKTRALVNKLVDMRVYGKKFWADPTSPLTTKNKRFVRIILE